MAESWYCYEGRLYWWVWQVWGETLYHWTKEEGLIIDWENFKFENDRA